jgi:hypothetical protein
MASNKQHDNHGISPTDQEAIRRLGERGGRRASAVTTEAPAAQSKPGRRHETSRRVSGRDEDTFRRLGDTIETPGKNPRSSTHRNR